MSKPVERKARLLQNRLSGLFRRKANAVRVLCRVSLTFSQCAREAGVHAPLTATAASVAHPQPSLARFYSESDGYLEFDAGEYRFSTGDEYRWPRYAVGPVLRLPQHRTAEDVDCIRTLMRQLRFCRRLPEQVLQKLAGNAFYMRLEKGRDVLRQGHIGYSFYMIFSGRVVVRNSASDSNSESVQLTKGDVFGDRALLFKSVRNATVTTETPLTELLIAYDDSFFESGLAEYLMQQVHKVARFLQGVPLLSNLQPQQEPVDAEPASIPEAEELSEDSHQDHQAEALALENFRQQALNSLASSCVQLDYLDGCQIVSDSRRTDCVWILMSGYADCYRVLDRPPDQFTAKVGHLVPGSVFGLAGGPDNDRPFRLISRGCRILSVSRPVLEEILTRDVAAVAAVEAAMRQPSDKRLRRACQGQTAWQRWRRSEVLATVRRLQADPAGRFERLHVGTVPIATRLTPGSTTRERVKLPAIQPAIRAKDNATDGSKYDSNTRLVQRSFTTFELLNRSA